MIIDKKSLMGEILMNHKLQYNYCWATHVEPRLVLLRRVPVIMLSTVVNLKGITRQTLYDFMLNCKDDDYRNWWPGTHLAFHTTRRFPNNLGNLVYFDEYVGSRRLKFEGIVVENFPARYLFPTPAIDRLILLY